MKNMLFLFVQIIGLNLFGPDDKIILRNGQEMRVEITQIDIDKVYFKKSLKKSVTQDVLDFKHIYMIYTPSRGNIYISSDGKRLTGEQHSYKKDATIIYLIKGAEIPAYDVKIQGENLFYLKEKSQGSNKSSAPAFQVLKLADVFMLKYKNGSRDIINKIVCDETYEHEAPNIKEDSENSDLKVVFHNVKANETLASISKIYDVSSNDIILWNDLPSTTNHNQPLQVDMQLMLYVKQK